MIFLAWCCLGGLAVLLLALAGGGITGRDEFAWAGLGALVVIVLAGELLAVAALGVRVTTG